MNQLSASIALSPVTCARSDVTTDTALRATAKGPASTTRRQDALDRLIELADMLDPEDWLAKLGAKAAG